VTLVVKVEVDVVALLREGEELGVELPAINAQDALPVEAVGDAREIALERVNETALHWEATLLYSPSRTDRQTLVRNEPDRAFALAVNHTDVALGPPNLLERGDSPPRQREVNTLALVALVGPDVCARQKNKREWSLAPRKWKRRGLTWPGLVNVNIVSPPSHVHGGEGAHQATPDNGNHGFSGCG